MLSNLEMLSNLRGISGNEEKVRNAILELIKDNSTTVTVDNLGDLIVFKKGKKTPSKKVLFSAHMDEVGFIVTQICEDGCLMFEPVGGVQTGVTLGKKVLIGEDKIIGIIGAKPIHLLEDDEKDALLKPSKMRIDIGAENKADAEKMVFVGDEVTFAAPFEKLGNSKIVAKAIDDRAGCALLIEMINSDLLYDCYFSFTVQEETGCAGAKAVAFTVKPDIAVAIEATTAGDLADVPEEKTVCKQGNGAVVSFMDNGTIYDKELYNNTLNWAKYANLKCQAKQGVCGGNESRNLQTAGGGAKTLAVSLPTRYIHSGSSVLQISDLTDTKDFLMMLTQKLFE